MKSKLIKEHLIKKGTMPAVMNDQKVTCMPKLDRSIFSSGLKCISIGRLSQEMIEFIIAKVPELDKRLSPDTDILFWHNRLKHTDLHKDDFTSDTEYYNCFESIPEIIRNPDYISIHKNTNRKVSSIDSISFIKDFSQHTSVAVRVSLEGKLSYRTMYPLMDAQLSDYLHKNTA